MKPVSDTHTEGELVAAWRRGEHSAAREVVDEHGPAMLRVALALCPRVEDAEDVVQDALLRAHRALSHFDPARGGLHGWLIGVTANRARQVRRGLARYSGFLTRLKGETVLEPPAFAPPLHADFEVARRILAALPPREREAFVLVEIEELTSIEAGRAMGISASTVRVLVTRARGRLQPLTARSVPAGAQGRGR